MTRIVQRAQIIDGSVTIKTSAGAFKVLTAHEREGIATVWYETIEKPVIPVDVTFTVVPTGGGVPHQSIYVGTAFIDNKASHIYQHPDL
jgi:hypothetical protein